MSIATKTISRIKEKMPRNCCSFISTIDKESEMKVNSLFRDVSSIQLSFVLITLIRNCCTFVYNIAHKYEGKIYSPISRYIDYQHLICFDHSDSELLNYFVFSLKNIWNSEIKYSFNDIIYSIEYLHYFCLNFPGSFVCVYYWD